MAMAVLESRRDCMAIKFLHATLTPFKDRVTPDSGFEQIDPSFINCLRCRIVPDSRYFLMFQLVL